MQIPKQAVLLRVFIGENDRADGSPLYEAIVLKAREQHLAGATVLRGPMGFGASSRLHTTKILRLSEDLPLVIEIVDSEEKVNAFLPMLDGMMTSGLITMKRFRSCNTAPRRNDLRAEHHRALARCLHVIFRERASYFPRSSARGDQLFWPRGGTIRPCHRWGRG